MTELTESAVRDVIREVLAQMAQSGTLPSSAPAATTAKYPLVVFSHGAGGWRSGHGNLLAGIASWGYVVASVDFPEYGFASFAGGGSRDMAARRATSAAAVEATLDLMDKETRAAGGVLSGVIDTSSVAAMGHSAGGGTMFGEIDNPRIDTVIVAFAEVGASSCSMSRGAAIVTCGASSGVTSRL